MKKWNIALLLVVLLFACEKFPEGGSVYDSRTNLIGTWQYKEVNIDYHHIPDTLFRQHYKNSDIVFEKGSMVRYHWRDGENHFVQNRQATYVFDYNKTFLNIVFADQPFEMLMYKVRKITDQEFHFEYDADNSHYDVYLIKK